MIRRKRNDGATSKGIEMCATASISGDRGSKQVRTLKQKVIDVAASDVPPIVAFIITAVITAIQFTILVPTMRLASNTLAVILYMSISPVLVFAALELVAYRIQRDAIAYKTANGTYGDAKPTMLTADAAGIDASMLSGARLVAAVAVAAVMFAVFTAAPLDAVGNRVVVSGDGTFVEMPIYYEHVSTVDDVSDIETVNDAAMMPVIARSGVAVRFDDAVASVTGNGCPSHDAIDVVRDADADDAVVLVSDVRYEYGGNGIGGIVFWLLGFDSGYEVDVVLPSAE